MDHYGIVNSVRAILYFRFLSAAADEYYRWFAGRRDLLGIVFSSGSGAVEAYIERVSRANRFEYGKVRVAGCVGWALCASITGVLFSIDPNITFWIASGFALVLGLLLWLSRPESSNSAQVIEALGANRQAFSLRTAAELLRMPRFWGFIVYVVGVASVYDVFDQQFANFFKSFSPVRSAVPKCLASSPPAASCSTR